EDAQGVLGRYYQFARTTQRGGANFPFSDPLAVTTISSDSVESGESKEFVPISDLIDRVDEFISAGESVIVTFHRIRSRESDPPGYALADFEVFIDYVAESGADVQTFSE